jgi:hypothetical protein
VSCLVVGGRVGSRHVFVPRRHAAHVIAAVRTQAQVMRSLLNKASLLAGEVIGLAGRHENVLLRDQLQVLQRSLLDSQQDYRRCIATHSAENAGAIRRGYVRQREDPVLAARYARKSTLLTALSSTPWFTLESLVPLPTEPFDVVYLWDGRGRDALNKSIRFWLARASALNVGAIFVLCGSGAEQQSWHDQTALPVRFMRGDLVSSLDSVRDHFVGLEAEALLDDGIERVALWETVDGWGPRAVVARSQHCESKLTDALLDNLLHVPLAQRVPRLCVSSHPSVLNKR